MCGIKVWDKSTSAGLCAKNAGEGRGGPFCGTLGYFQCEARYSEQVQGTGQLSSCG